MKSLSFFVRNIFSIKKKTENSLHEYSGKFFYAGKEFFCFLANIQLSKPQILSAAKWKLLFLFARRFFSHQSSMVISTRYEIKYKFFYVSLLGDIIFLFIYLHKRLGKICVVCNLLWWLYLTWYFKRRQSNEIIELVVIYFCFLLRYGSRPYEWGTIETRIHSCRFASLAC